MFRHGSLSGQLRAQQLPADQASVFEEGYNCAQAVFLAFAEEQGLDRPAAARLVSGMGGGMGRLRETCGAVSSMVKNEPARIGK